jgi:hypothetical protein
VDAGYSADGGRRRRGPCRTKRHYLKWPMLR